MKPRPRKLKLLRWLPRSLLMTHGPADGGSIYLSFDDGPDIPLGQHRQFPEQGHLQPGERTFG